MKRVMCVVVALLLLLAGCSSPEPTPTLLPEPDGTYTQDIFELTQEQLNVALYKKFIQSNRSLLDRYNAQLLKM